MSVYDLFNRYTVKISFKIIAEIGCHVVIYFLKLLLQQELYYIVLYYTAYIITFNNVDSSS